MNASRFTRLPPGPVPADGLTARPLDDDDADPVRGVALDDMGSTVTTYGGKRRTTKIHDGPIFPRRRS